WLSAKFGRYPYPQLTVAHGLLGGGMEYPMLVMNASERESLILHEVGHIYFFGILANNEWKEAWLDEGFTTFQTRWYMETKYGKWGQDRETSLKQANWLQRHRPSKTRRERRRDSALAFMNSDHNEPISRISYRFNEPLAYSVNAYTKGSLLLDMLKYVVGDSTFEKICRAYFDRWAFKHVNEERFKNVCEDVSGRELDWFFNQWLHDTVTVDYALADVGKHKVKGNWYTEVSILRKDRGKMPVEVELTTESGETFLKRWHGMHESGKVLFQTTSKPRRVLLDPNDAVLDKYRLNNGPLKLEVVFDYPNMSYNPRDAYLITWRPSGWYNSVDKLRIGGRLKGRYGASRNAGLGAWYGVDSKELDARFTYSNPITPLGPNIRGAAGIQKMEGRFEVDAHLAYSGGKFIAHPPKHRFWVGFNHSRLLEGKGDRYTIREFDQKTDTTLTTWEEGVVNNLYFRYNYDPRGLNWFSNLSAGLDIVLDDWTSDFDYRRAFAELRFWLPKNDEGVFLRFYTAKVFSSERAPLQDLVFLEGANPRERFKRFYLRSDGALPEELHYHLPGGGNVRGYYNQPIFGDQIVALNLELRNTFRPQLFGKRLDKFLGETSLVAFVDLASMEFIGSQNDFFAGAGLGLRFQNVLPDNWYTLFTGGRHVTLRLDFPIWIDDPLPNENAVRFRWVFGFEQAI
ncbi:hypothetical protein GWO43_03900, partial [candidate division KSB1 bacterium]|nr:hypothetical protein [candidate division KSB1 bacterium]NIR70455.1 hypothetical protein [candidate division KSB1 bacterium]NIS23185.1 hypothetical protein [candidate division KSB1 bacterium]NIT70045.1 hypothetical protein [candidate division KSB1 bacterium]NIU23682.1 hypothetical protein [candidate division KSB1 bacterium]